MFREKKWNSSPAIELAVLVYIWGRERFQSSIVRSMSALRYFILQDAFAPTTGYIYPGVSARTFSDGRGNGRQTDRGINECSSYSSFSMIYVFKIKNT